MKMTKVYLAGKIGHTDWRHDFFDLRDSSDEYVQAIPLEKENERELPSNGNLFYSGPFFIACDHGCAHGRSNHGRGVNQPGCIPYNNSQYATLERCKTWINNADYIFVWLNDNTAFGTLTEIGYAHALGKKIFIGFPYDHSSHDDNGEEESFSVNRDMWFALQMADRVVEAGDHKEAWELFKIHYKL